MKRQTLDLPSAPTATPVTVETAPVARPAERRGIQTFRSLRHHDFRLLFAGILGVSAGQWIEQTAVAWVILQRTDSAAMVGLVYGARALPSLFLAPLGGVIADRFQRRRILIISQATVALLSATMATLDLAGVLATWHIFCLVFGFGIVWSLNNPVRHSIIPQLVPREDLTNAVALNSTGFNIARSIGPFIGAALLGGLGFGKTYAIAAGLYAAVLFFTVRIETRGIPSAAAVRESVIENLRGGFRYLKQDRLIFTLIFLAVIPVSIGMPYMALVPVFARDVMHKDEVAFGVMLAFTGFGSLVGTLSLATFDTQRRGGLVLLSTSVAFGVTVILFGLSTSYGLALGILFFSGMFSMVYLSLSNTLLQLLVDDRVRGRVMSILMMEFGLTPLGAVAAGAVAQATSPAATVIAMGGAQTALALGSLLLLRNIRALDASKPRQSPAVSSPSPGR